GIDVSELQKAKIKHCIEFHEEYDFTETGKTALDIETLILQDADNLDALGAIGIGRTFAYSGAHNVIMWQPEIPFESGLYADEQPDPSTLHHFYSKLLKMKENMNTQTALKLAQKRHDFMKSFLEEFFEEWQGNC
ncbi:MAG: hypothetical protein P9L97_13195, partial [Candidatus Tenebribacter davisii]|nr:hypothetical protein [Candidatus Tenebribacter davisii]